MQVFCEDERLNISTAYLRPGFAFGGSCLPKDMRALMHLARVHDVEIPVLTGILRSNSPTSAWPFDAPRRGGAGRRAARAELQARDG